MFWETIQLLYQITLIQQPTKHTPQVLQLTETHICTYITNFNCT